MKKMTACIMAMVLLLTMCNVHKSYGQAPVTVGLLGAEAAGSEQTAEPSATAAVDSQEGQKDELEIGREIEPLVSEKIDTTKQGVGMSGDSALFREMARGDDGSCYYFRNEGKGKNKKSCFTKIMVKKYARQP